MIIKYISAILLLSLVSCTSAEEFEIKSGDVASTVAAGSQSEAELKETLKEIEKEEKERVAVLKASSTSLSFDKLTHDYGDVLPDSDNETVFTLTNTGDKPLIVSDVSASCGCTMPEKPEGPISPGESDVIRVVFHPKPGQVNEIKKTVTVTANTVEKVHLLEIRAFVKE